MPNTSSDSEAHYPYKKKILRRNDIGDNVPRRGGIVTPIAARVLLKLSGWKTVGEIPNISQAVCLAVPHTSNVDGIYAILSLLSLDFGINIMGKKSLFKNPLISKFMYWSGVIPIDRKKKGSVLQASIDEFNKGEALFLGLSPEGTRDYSKNWKSGFYYLAMGANVPILPVAMDYKTKEVRFMNPFYPTGDYDKDLPKILAMYQGVVAHKPHFLSQPLQDINLSK